MNRREKREHKKQLRKDGMLDVAMFTGMLEKRKKLLTQIQNRLDTNYKRIKGL
jgi:hypothetical protein